jgi:hypothetical protein
VNINLPAAIMTFTPSGGTYLLSDDGNGNPIYSTDWQGSVLIDIGPYVPVGSFATEVFVSLDNTLTALSQAGTTAFIQKKDFEGVTITVDTDDVIPEPTTIAMSILCCGLMAFKRSR